MAELNSSKDTAGTNHTSILSLFSNLIFKVTMWFLAIVAMLSFIVPRFIPIEKIIPIPEINQAIYQKTGLNIEIAGRARLSILPFFGIIAHNVLITNPSFEGNNVLSAKKIDVKIAIFPLFLRKLVIKNIILDNAKIDIIKCNNAYNFFTPPLSSTPISSTATSQKPFLKFKSISLSHLRISNTNFSYKVCKTDIFHKITNIEAKISAPNADAKIESQSSMSINNYTFNININSSSLNELLKKNKGEIELSMQSELGNIKADAKYKINKKNPILFDELKLNITANNLSGERLAKQTQKENKFLNKLPPIDFSFGAELKNHKLSVSHFVVKSKYLSMKAREINGTISQNPLLSNVNGSLEFSFDEIKNFCDTFEIQTKNFITFPQKINSQIDFTLENGMLKTHKSSYIKFDDTQINIESIINFLTENKFINLNITADSLNIDRYFSKNDDKISKIKIQNNIENAQIHIPQLGKISTESRISIDSLKYKNINFEDITSVVKINNDSISLKLQANAFQGKISLEGGITQNKGVVQAVSSMLSVKKVEISDILKFFNQEVKLSGVSTFQVNLSANGSTIVEFMKQNSGNIVFESTNSTLHGIDIDSLIYDIKKDYKQIFSGSIKEKYFSSIKKSKIKSISANVSIKNGVLINEKIVVKKNELNFNIAGETSLINSNIHYVITPIKGSTPLPSLVLNGTTNDIIYSIDASSYIKQSAKSLIEKEFSSKTTQEKLKKLKNLFNNLKK